MYSNYSKRSKTAGFSEPAALSDSDLRVAAINLLSRREYSRHELIQKLEPRCKNELQLDQLLDHLTQSGYQSDERFAESFLRSRINRGLGRLRIERELKDRGIKKELIEQVLSGDTDWFLQAYESGLKKSQSLNLTEYKEKQKLYRYLAYRGFSMAEIQYAVEQYLELSSL